MTDFCDGLFASLCVAFATVSSLFTFFRYALPLSWATPSMALSVHRDHQAHRATPVQYCLSCSQHPGAESCHQGSVAYGRDAPVGVRVITGAPGVLDALPEFDQRGIVFSIGHRCVESCQLDFCSFSEYVTSIATTDFAMEAVRRGARLITHLFNAMPQLHHRDPSIIGLLGASPHISPPSSPATSSPTSPTPPVTPVPSSVYFRVKCRCARQRSHRARRSTTTRHRPRLPWAAP